MIQQPDKNALPQNITRPLFAGAVFLLLLIAFVTGWSIYAPIATSVHVSGFLVSSKPSDEVQHPFGGQINWIGVKPHQQISAGQTLLRFDVQQEQQVLSDLASQISELTEEQTVIEVLLSGGFDAAAQQANAPQRFVEQSKIQDQRAVSHRNKALSHRAQARAAEDQIAILEQRISLLNEQYEVQLQLRQQGLSRRAELSQIQGDLLQMAGNLRRQQAVMALQLAEAIQADRQAELVTSEFRAMLLGVLKDNRRHLTELGQRRSSVENVIELADVRSPISGHIQSLAFDTTQMYATRGETLFVVSQLLQKPYIQLIVPVNLIDQVIPGMTGKLTIPGLPSREMPVLEVVVKTISPEATKDQNGNPIGYAATAIIKEGHMQRAHVKLQDRLRLSTDMPVSVALAGRSTTLAEYLFQPVANIYSKALQD